jgi:hypothetical protein
MPVKRIGLQILLYRSRQSVERFVQIDRRATGINFLRLQIMVTLTQLQCRQHTAQRLNVETRIEVMPMCPSSSFPPELSTA